MYERVLVPVDGSEVSKAVLGAVSNLATALGSKVTVFHVDCDQSPLRSDKDQGPNRLETYLTEIKTTFSSKGVKVEVATACGRPSEEILKKAEEGYGLIAMATHARTGSARSVYGSTTDAVITSAKAPMLLMHPTADVSSADPGIKAVVVPLDGSAFGEAVLPDAEALAARLGAQLVLTRVLPAEATLAGMVDPEFYDPESYKQAEQSARAYLDGKVQALLATGVSAKAELHEGYAPDQIVDAAEMIDGSLIFMSTHGHTGSASWPLGSVADRVVRRARRPVIIDKPQGLIMSLG